MMRRRPMTSLLPAVCSALILLGPVLTGPWALSPGTVADPFDASGPVTETAMVTASTTLSTALRYHAYIPLVESHGWGPAELANASFEGDWWRETDTGQEFGEIFVPEGWMAFWKEGGEVPHDPDNEVGYGRPEMHVINKEPPYLDPPRIYSGTRAVKWFTFYRVHDAGIYQQVPVTPGSRYRLQAVTHAWYSQFDDPYRSQYSDGGVATMIDDGDPGMEVMVGIDPCGDVDPWSDSVIWTGANIYDQFDTVSVVARAEAPTITLFLRTQTLYPFKHCDAYWDNVSLEIYR
ncbi:MAG: hypothetical protein ACP5HG_05425 [Anaerolineae bacterium]